MSKIKLTREEQAIEDAIGRGEYIPVTGKHLEEVARAIAARKKDMTLTIRVNGQDIDHIKKMAQKRGIPYQTYLAEVIHRVAQLCN